MTAVGPDADEAMASNGIEGSGCLDDYVVEKAIGRGHFSVVHRAVRKSNQQRVALKKVQIFDMMDAKARDRCLKEVHLLRTLPKHPCIITYLDSFIEQNELFIIFEWAEHGDLRRLLRRAQEANATLQERQIWGYFTQICDGVRHMHEARVMHRDIKPANIFLAANGCVKLGDLGLGRAFSSQTYEANSKVGTPLYMSPEVLDGRGYEWKSDIWSLGCLLYELATLRSPFKNEGDNLYTLFKKISVGKYKELPDTYSPHLSRLVSSMIQIDPKLRPDIHAVLKFASKALASFNETPAASPPASGSTAAAATGGSGVAGGGGSGGGGGGGSGGSGGGSGGVAECLVVMEAVLDKLKLLEYERGLLKPRGLPPLPRWYFCASGAAPPPVLFHYFFSLACWLLHTSVAPKHRLWQMLPPATPSGFESEALAASSALLECLKASGAPLSSYAAMPAHRLRAATGAEVCALLNALTDSALVAAGFSWGTPVHTADEVEAEVEVEEEVGQEVQGADEEVDEVRESAGSTEDAQVAPRLLPVLLSEVDAASWQEECDRVAPELLLRLLWSQGHWRHRLATAQQHAPAVSEGLPVLAPTLESITQRAATQEQKLAPLRSHHQDAMTTLQAANDRVSQAQQTVNSLAEELTRLEEQVKRTQQALANREREMGGTAPLDRIRGGLRLLRAEAKELMLREAILQHELNSKLQQRGARGLDSARPHYSSDVDASDLE